MGHCLFSRSIKYSPKVHMICTQCKGKSANTTHHKQRQTQVPVEQIQDRNTKRELLYWFKQAHTGLWNLHIKVIETHTQGKWNEMEDLCAIILLENSRQEVTTLEIPNRHPVCARLPNAATKKTNSACVEAKV